MPIGSNMGGAPFGTGSRPTDEAASCTASSPKASIPSADDLRHCPFCGSEAEYFMRYKTPRPLWGVRCTGRLLGDCCVSVDPAERTKEASKARWNGDDHPLHRMVKLDEELGLYDDLQEQHEAMADVMSLRRLSSSQEHREIAENAIAVWRKVERKLEQIKRLSLACEGHSYDLIYALADEAASAIEARSDATTKIGAAEGESATRKGDAHDS